MGNRIAVLDAGVMQQLSTPSELVEKPANEFVDQFLGHQRFQLSLVTTKVKDVMSAQEAVAAPASRPSTFVRARSSLVEALDTFKRTKERKLPVYDGEAYVGEVQRREVSDAVSRTVNDMGGAE
jgi:ABC-type proline/glycine betaine transport system ATPase subunit